MLFDNNGVALDPNARITVPFSLGCLLSVNGANPNGDPDNNNIPRTDIDGYGVLTGTCISHHMKNALCAVLKEERENGEIDPQFEPKLQTFYDKLQTNKKTSMVEILLHPTVKEKLLALFEIKNKAKGKKKSKASTSTGEEEEKVDVSLVAQIKDAETEVKKALWDAFIEIRLFGFMCPSKTDILKQLFKDAKITFTDAPNLCMTQTISSAGGSLQEIYIDHRCITKSYNATPTVDGGKGSDTMGQNHVVSNALYYLTLNHNPSMANFGLTYLDLEYLLKAIRFIFLCDPSAARPYGSINPLYITLNMGPGSDLAMNTTNALTTYFTKFSDDIIENRDDVFHVNDFYSYDPMPKGDLPYSTGFGSSSYPVQPCRSFSQLPAEKTIGIYVPSVDEPPCQG